MKNPFRVTLTQNKTQKKRKEKRSRSAEQENTASSLTLSGDHLLSSGRPSPASFFSGRPSPASILLRRPSSFSRGFHRYC
ncbi:hypothetical protein HanPSC8_Chr08g0323551 [Helianthus annuus]|nr:hypothetical protein HanPSC8_Chr08g0323551 [Helianthus annuus]